MFLIVTLACYERVIVDARIDTRAQTLHVAVQQQGVPQPDGCSAVDLCLAAVRSHIAEETRELADHGATNVRVGIALRGDELDFIDVYDAPLASKLLEGGAILQRFESTDHKGRTHSFAGVFVQDDPELARTTVTVDGPYDRIQGGADNPSSLWTFRKGRPHLHVLIELFDEGKETVVEPWVPSVPGLADALRASGWMIDPASS